MPCVRGPWVIALVLLASCGAAPAKAVPAAAAPAPPAADRPGARSPSAPRAAPTPPAFRLPASARPLAYAADLTVDPAQPTFSGRLAIDLELSSVTDVIWLNAQDLSVASATVEGVGAVAVVAAPPRFVGLHAPAPLGPGPVHVEIVYQGKVVRGDSLGFFAQKIGDAWYGFTQFEAVGARMVFPCFDEPGFKVPWKLTLHVPKGLVAVSNAPSDPPVEEEGGGQAYHFLRTPPLPSYLIAFAIGPFEFVDAGRTQGGLPVRVLAPRGRTREAAYTAQVTAPLLTLLEKYFGTPYPFDKLDVVPVPEAFGFSAMENPGLITYVESLVLHRPEEITLADRRAYADTAVHEMAHQWFGNLVTSAWWDDIWLNEALATWIESKILDQWKPEWGVRVGDVSANAVAMAFDDLDSARRVREPVHDENDIENAFDGITYNKGATVLRMLELWLGEATFQKGIRAYLGKRARGVATYDDFVADMGEAIGRDLSAPLGSFLDQTGVPLLGAELRCEAGKPPVLALSQKRYLPLGSQGDRDRLWKIPVCVRWSVAGDKPGSACTLLAGGTGELELTSAKKCPEWILPNQGGSGYYHSKLPEPLWARLLDARTLARLGADERLAVHNDVEALVASGDLDATRLLELTVLLASDKNRYVREATLGDFWALDDMIGDDVRPAYQRALRKIFGPAAHKLGFVPRRGEPEDTSLLRPQLIQLVGDAGDDAVLLAQARKLAWKWLDDHSAVAPEMLDTVLHLAASRGDRALHDRLLTELHKATELQDRDRLFAAMGSFRDPALVKQSLDLVLAGDFALTETIDLLWAAAGWRGTRDLAWAYLLQHYDELAAHLPKERISRLVRLGAGYCSEAKRAETAEFFRARNAQALGGPRDYQQTLESFTLCVAFRERQLASVTKFLERYR